MIRQTAYQFIEKPHSRLGVVSVVVGILLPVLFILIAASAFSLDTGRNAAGNDILGGLMLITLSFPLFHAIAFVLGLAGIFSKKTKKTFPAVGMILNGIILLTGFLLIYFFLSNLSLPVC